MEEQAPTWTDKTLIVYYFNKFDKHYFVSKYMFQYNIISTFNVFFVLHCNLFLTPRTFYALNNLTHVFN